MKKILAILACMLLTLCLLVACGDTETSDSPNNSSNTSNSVGDGTNNDNNGVTPDNKKYNYNMSQYIILPNYKNYEAQISLDSLQRMIDNYIMEYAVKSKRQICVMGDVVNVSYTGYYLDENGDILKEDGKPVIFDEGESFGVYLGSHMAVEDFENGIVGMEIDNIKDVYVKMPDDYFEESLAGKTVVFEIVLNAIYEAPVYDNRFVSTYFSDYTNTYDFEEHLKDELVLDAVYKYIQENAVILSYPEKEYKDMADQLKASEDSFLKQNGMTIDQYIEKQFGMTRDQYIKQEMKRAMIFYAIAQSENIEITSQMIKSERASLINYYKEYYKSMGVSDSQALSSAKALVDDLGDDYIYENVLYEQVDDLLPHLVTVKEKPATYKSITQIIAERQQLQQGNEIGNLCPDFDIEVFDENGATGDTIDPSKNIGKITIINFWGTWCGPCKSELPDFDKLATNYKDVLTIYAVHSTEGYKNATNYVAQNFPNSNMIFMKDYLIDPNDKYSGDAYFNALGGEGAYPYTVILDENGVIIYKHTGMLEYDQLERIIIGASGGKLNVEGVGEITAEQILACGISKEALYAKISNLSFNDGEKQAMKDYLAGPEGDNEEKTEEETPSTDVGENELPLLPPV